MGKSLFICGIDQGAGSSVVALGLFGALRKAVKEIGFFKPVGGGAGDKSVAVIKSAYGLPDDPSAMCPLTLGDAREAVAQSASEDLLKRIESSFEKTQQGKEFMLIEGITSQRATGVADLALNENVAAALGSPVLLVARSRGDDVKSAVEEVMASILTAKEGFEAQGSSLLGVVLNRVTDSCYDEFKEKASEALKKAGVPLYGILPELSFLSYPKLDQIAAELEAEVLTGKDGLATVATKVLIAAMEPRNFLKHLDTEQALVIVPGDREAILATLACTQKSGAHRSVSGVVLTGGLIPAPEIVNLMEEVTGPNLPLLSVKTDTFTTTQRIQTVSVDIRPQDRDKIDTAISAVADKVEHEKLWKSLEMPRPAKQKSGSDAFLDKLIEQAKASGKRIVLPEGDEPRTVKAVSKILRDKVCPVALLGDPDKIQAAAKEAGVSLKGDVEIIKPSDYPKFDTYVETVVELRKGKRGGMTPEVAHQWLNESTIHFGTLMVQCGDAAGLVSGAIHSTGDTIRPALQIIRVKPEVGVVSSVFFMALKDRVLVYGDCAIVPNPNTQELAAIALSSAQTARAFGIEPRVAMLSYSTGKSGAGESVDKVVEATKLIKERNPDFSIDGPLQYDAAIDPQVGKLKLPDSPVAGRANVFIFPDLDAGNIAYKAVQRSAGALAVGPVLQGLNKPVNDLSRGCSVDDIVYTVAVTAIQAAAG